MKTIFDYIDCTYNGRELLKSYSLSKYGIWRIKGEDPNCDLGGYHHNPELGIFKGKLEDVIRYAISLPSFVTWGAGGIIEFLGEEIPEVTYSIKASLIKEIASLKNKVAMLEKELEQ